MNERAKEALIRFLEERDELDVHGNSLLVFHKDKEIFRHYTGEVNKDTLFRIFSMTKVVTVTAALQLFELGKFTMEDPVSKFLPEFANMTVWDEEKQEAVPAKNEMRMRHLFSMSAGITYEGDSCETERQYVKLKEELMKEYPHYTTQQYIRMLPKAPLAFEPGSHWRYSLCHDVLGAVIEVISGQLLGEYMHDHIFAPLGMEHTFFRCPAEYRSRMATKMLGDHFSDDMFAEENRYEAGGGGLLSTLDDYMKLANTLTRGGTSENGVRILGRKTIDLLRSDQLNEEQKKDFNWDYLNGYSYGMGVRTNVDPAKSGISGSVGEFGWCGVMGTWVLMDPEEELTVVYMHQRFPNLEKYVQTHLRAMIYGAL
ncbi:MAG: beta-lactamase family protein [Clostridiales bacterium]|nr:beta-lactamase family protein [Candidatus Blautia equi]